MQNELISVIVPVYNMERYLERCVRSITAQTYTQLEILLVNDGSTDSSLTLCRQLAAQDQRIRVLTQENHGSSAARNYGIRESAGAYLSFIDSDDYIAPDMMEKLYRTMQTTGLQMVQGARDEIDENGAQLPDICIPPKEMTIWESHDFLRELLLHRGDCSFCTRLTDRRLFDAMQFPEGRLNEDFHVMVQLLPHLKGIASLPDRVYHVFYKSDSNTRTVSAHAFSRVYADNVDNAELVTQIVAQHYPDLLPVAMRFGLYQRLDYLLHIPIEQMRSDNGQYIQIIRYLRQHRRDIRESSDLTKKNKQYLLLFSIAPVLIRKVHRRIMACRKHR